MLFEFNILPALLSPLPPSLSLSLSPHLKNHQFFSAVPSQTGHATSAERPLATFQSCAHAHSFICVCECGCVCVCVCVCVCMCVWLMCINGERTATASCTSCMKTFWMCRPQYNSSQKGHEFRFKISVCHSFRVQASTTDQFS